MRLERTILASYFNSLIYCLNYQKKNILLAQRFRSKKPGPQFQQLAAICERLKLSSNVLKRKAQDLSVGQQQGVAVARA
jgi:ABC-type lipoprotein export system ATPase subunit